MIVTKLETWRCQRGQQLFDEARQGSAPMNYHWFEEPFRDFELDKYSKLCAALDIPVAGTETTRGGPWGVGSSSNQVRRRGYCPSGCVVEA